MLLPDFSNKLIKHIRSVRFTAQPASFDVESFNVESFNVESFNGLAQRWWFEEEVPESRCFGLC